MVSEGKKKVSEGKKKVSEGKKKVSERFGNPLRVSDSNTLANRKRFSRLGNA